MPVTNKIFIVSLIKFCLKKFNLSNINLLVDKKVFNGDIFVKVRSTGKLLNAKVNLKETNTAEVNLKIPEDGISPGQACVFYKKDNIGFKVLFLHKILPDFFLGLGSQTSQKVKKVFLDDIAKGSAILRGISKFDIGQSIVLQEGNVIGVEAAQGTDNLIKQSLPYLINVKKGVLIKLVKVNQDLRADLPTIGLDTIRDCVKSNIKGIVIKSNQHIFLNQKESIKYANKNNIFLSVI